MLTGVDRGVRGELRPQRCARHRSRALPEQEHRTPTVPRVGPPRRSQRFGAHPRTRRSTGRIEHVYDFTHHGGMAQGLLWIVDTRPARHAGQAAEGGSHRCGRR
ncbi:hypothetical protein SERN_0675 [Serinibacter arcticus]|uniref:Uncharacterized protein n=1 Tax=Serinibacter arcticus TaxID=1655435 RepID=A0A4Z1E7L8_9MICO|nr:hypothetical protein SERN_0675 [Serinibacter arcticus]